MILTGRKVFLIGVCWFLAVLGVNSIFLKQAFESRDGLVIEEASKYGTNYNALISQSEAQKNAQLGAFVQVQSVSPGLQRLSFKAFEKENERPVKSVTVNLIRPLEPQQDQKFEVVCGEGGCLSPELTLKKGPWDVNAVLHLQSPLEGKVVEVRQRLHVGTAP